MLVASSDWPDTVTQVNGIAVNQTFKRLAFTHTAMYVNSPVGSVLGEYVIHYTDGTEATIPIAMDRQVRDWFVPAHKSDDNAPKPSRIFNTPSGVELSVYSLLWDNPHPSKRIQSVDLRSKSSGVLCLLAVTGERP